MKKLITSVLALMVVISSIVAQETPDKAYKLGSRALSAYNLDPANNATKLDEAKSMSDIAITGAEEKAQAKVWQSRGDILVAIAQNNYTRKSLDANFKPSIPDAAMLAKDAFAEALKLAAKKYETKDALKGLGSIQGLLNDFGVTNGFDLGDFETAYTAFNSVLEVHKLLKDNGEKSTLDEPLDYQNQLYYAGLAAINAGNIDKATPLYLELQKLGYNKAALYDGLYNITKEKDPAQALAYLEEGRKKFPEEVSLLFTEINHYLAADQLDKLIDKLGLAIEKEPENMALYTTLGNVYDNMYQRELEAKNYESADKSYELARQQYAKVLEKEPKNFDATYSIGALYYNKAAALMADMSKLADDYSPAGLKKYAGFKKEAEDMFNKALPFFQKAESMNPNDQNTIIALKEIFARQEKFDLSNEFKQRLQNIVDKKPNTASYFKG